MTPCRMPHRYGRFGKRFPHLWKGKSKHLDLPMEHTLHGSYIVTGKQQKVTFLYNHVLHRICQKYCRSKYFVGALCPLSADKTTPTGKFMTEPTLYIVETCWSTDCSLPVGIRHMRDGMLLPQNFPLVNRDGTFPNPLLFHTIVWNSCQWQPEGVWLKAPPQLHRPHFQCVSVSGYLVNFIDLHTDTIRKRTGQYFSALLTSRAPYKVSLTRRTRSQNCLQLAD
jgi:hypothetical protein